MLTELYLQNFKAFQEQRLTLRPLTIVIGPNNSGKSSLLAPLRILAQTLISFDIGVPLLLNGALGDFGSYRDLVHGNHRGRPMTLALTWQPTYWQRHHRLRKRRHDRELEATENRWTPREQAFTMTLEFKYRLQRRELVVRRVDLDLGGQPLISVEMAKDSGRHVITRVAGRTLPSHIRQALQSLIRLHHFLPRVAPGVLASRGLRKKLEGLEAEGLSFDALDAALEDAYDVGLLINRDLQAIDYLGPMRSPAERTYHHTGERHTTIGATGQNWANALAIESRSRLADQPVREAVVEWLSAAGLASDIDIRWASDSHYEVHLQHPVSKEYENIADVGQGNSQVLPVLIGGLGLEAGHTFVVEEPEIHLHPRAQAELGTFFKRLYENGVQAFVETHSEYLLLRLQQHIAAGEIPAGDVAVYYVHASEGEKEVTRVPMDPGARFADVVPGGFFPEGLQEAKQLARIRAQSR